MTFDRKGAAALAAAARAFDKAQEKGYAWPNEDGGFSTWEQTGIFQMPDPITPEQLRLDV